MGIEINTDFRDSLAAMISGKSTRKQVRLAFTQFCKEATRILSQKEAMGWNIRNYSRSHTSEIEEIAIDFIGPLFARDERNIYIVLKHRMESELETNDELLFAAFQRLVYSHIQQELIRLFQERDPVGKVLYRSLRFVLTKNPLWEKTKTSNRIAIISERGNPLPVVEESEFIECIKNLGFKGESITKMMELLLRNIIETNGFAVPVPLLFQYLRVRVQEPLNIEFQGSLDPDPTLEETIMHHVVKTISYIDSSFLSKYVASEKMTPGERMTFKKGLKKILIAFSNGGVEDTYAAYLNRSSDQNISDSQYKRKYKKQFEYVAKVAKKDFSARIKSDFKQYSGPKNGRK